MNALTAQDDYRRFCEERLADPYPLLQQLRGHEPIHWCAPLNMWLVTRYDDVAAGLRDVARLSSDRSAMYSQALPDALREAVAPLLQHVRRWIQLTDEPDHGRLRKLVNAAFTPRMIATLRPRIEQITDQLLVALPRGEPFDLVARFGYPLPATVICEMLGIPLAERDAFRRATEVLMQFSTRGGPALREHAPTAVAALRELTTLFQRLVAERRAAPQADLLSALVAAEADGARLSNEELYAMSVFIFLAGHETTTNGLVSGVLNLLQHPDQWQRLRDHPEQHTAGAVEETLRYESPVPRAVRQARVDFEWRGRAIRAGQLVVLLLGAANRDPAQFPEPDRFDITRQPNRHLGFGYGVHFCLGAPLARLEMARAFCAIARQLPGLKLIGHPLRWKPMMGIRALEELQVCHE